MCPQRDNHFSAQTGEGVYKAYKSTEFHTNWFQKINFT